MLHLDYIGLLNTDHQRPGPVQMFLQGRESRARYVLDTLPAWMTAMLGPVPECLGERNCTSTGPKLSKTSSVHVPHPWRMRHFEGTDRSFALWLAFPAPDDYDHSVTLGLSSRRPSRSSLTQHVIA
jgi:hypothetical protein